MPDGAAKVYSAPRDAIEPAFGGDAVPVLLCCDGRFFPHAGVVLASILANAAPGAKYDFLVVVRDVSPAMLSAASAWIRQYPNASLRFVSIDAMLDAAGKESFYTTKSFSLAVYFRLFAPDAFALYNRIAYLDCDIAVLADVAGFYNQDLGGNLLGACHDYVAERQSMVDPELGAFWRDELGIQPGSAHFLSGGVVMDLAGMRRENTQAALLEKLRSIDKPGLPDQHIMNAVLKDSVKYLDIEWNYLDWMADPLETSPNFRRIDASAFAPIRAARDRFKIIHYAEKKPWSTQYLGGNDGYYWRYAVKSPFYREIADSFRNGCGMGKLVGQYVLTNAQRANFALRAALSGGGEKEKQKGRLYNLDMRRRRLFSLMRRFGPLGFKGMRDWETET